MTSSKDKRSSIIGGFKSLRISRISSMRSNSSRSSQTLDDPLGASDLASVPRSRSQRSRASHNDDDADFLGANISPPTRRPNRPGMNAFTVPSNEPPPAYSEQPTAASGPRVENPAPPSLSVTAPSPAEDQSTQHMRAPSPARSAFSTSSHRSIVSHTPEDPYAFLNSFDTIFLIDDSGSMAGRSWREASQALKFIAPICTAHDEDGIDIYFLNHKSADPGDVKNGAAAGGYRNVRSPEDVERIFKAVKPSGGTPTGTRCHNILRPYINQLQQVVKAGDDVEDSDIKPLNVIVITDGVPSDDVESVLLTAAKKLDKIDAPPYQVGVQFFQVGNEEGAKEALNELDDHLGAHDDSDVRDIVDTVTWTGGPIPEGQTSALLTGESILKAVLGAVVKRLDRRRASGEHGDRV